MNTHLLDNPYVGVFEDVNRVIGQFLLQQIMLRLNASAEKIMKAEIFLLLRNLPQKNKHNNK
jgi:hypothetical protein